ncbi:hypothetical protein C1H46_000213 [Malus baccata]|uniref:Uncharacterized protein n=1 Tax=Malus baccata TaxID=106549 RepID=A0A540NTC2_MALBA|nr:hypothetical protein C1H46_000213 [Malus baccata]
MLGRRNGVGCGGVHHQAPELSRRSQIQLSMPMPALPTTFNLPPEDSNTSRVTLVPLHTINTSQSEILVQNSLGLRL